jgi:hypothetical protein
VCARAAPGRGTPTAGYTNLWVGQHVGIRIIAFTPADDRTRLRLERLHESLE